MVHGITQESELRKTWTIYNLINPYVTYLYNILQNTEGGLIRTVHNSKYLRGLYIRLKKIWKRNVCPLRGCQYCMFIYISKHLSNDGLFTQSIKLEYNNTKTGTLYSYWRFILFAAVSSGVCCPRDLGVDGLASLRRFVPLACGVTD